MIPFSSLPVRCSLRVSLRLARLIRNLVFLSTVVVSVQAAESLELTGYVAAKSVDCFNPEHHHHAPEFFVVDDETGARLQLTGFDEQLQGIHPQQKVRVTAVQAPSREAAVSDEESGEELTTSNTSSGFQVQQIELLPMKQGAGGGDGLVAEGGSNSLTMLSTLLVFISTNSDGCMTSESNARGLLFDNATNANEGMQAITKGRYGLQLGNGTGVPDDHTIDLLLDINSTDQYEYDPVGNPGATRQIDTDRIEDLALDALFGAGGMGLNRTDWDRVLLFAPGGIRDAGFTAYAYYPWGSYTTQGLVSMYGSSYGNNRMNGYLHELGHNFGFAHSSKGGSEYGDRTCVMGLSNDSTKTETYGAAKLMETPWLDTFNSSGTPASLTLTQDTTLDLYPLSSDLTVVDETVALSISGTDVYVAYHQDDRPYGFLSQSGDRNKVFVYTRASGSFQRSFQVASLSEGEDYDSTVDVQFGAYGPGLEYATVSIDVADGNTMPELATTTYGTGQNQSVVLTMPGTDADGDSISYATLTDPANGTLTGSYPNLTYTPDTDFTGSDTFRITASDALISNFITVTVLTFVDTDTDGLEDDWEIQYFGTLSQGPNDNPDGDREDNLTEFQNGTDPTRVPTSFANKLTGAVIGTSGSYQNNPAWDKDEAFDGDLTTYYDAANGDGDWTGLDLGSAKTIGLIKFAPRSSWPGRMVGGQFQGSNTSDFSSGVVTFHTIGSTPDVGVLTEQDVNDPGSYRYVRYLSPDQGFCNVAEVEFWEDGAPDAPTGLSAASVTGAVDLDWNDNSDVDFASYNVYRGTSPGTFDPTPIATGLTSIQYSDTTVANGTTYSYFVSAVDTDGYEGANSAEASIEYVVNEVEPYVDAGPDQSVTMSGDAPWTPAQLTTEAWYDASDAGTISDTGGTVTQWNDKSPNGLHLQAAGGREPTTGVNTINGTNALDFTSDAMSTSSNPFGASMTDAFVIMVHKVDDDSNQGTLFSLTGSSGSRWQAHAPYNGTAYFDCGGTGGASRVNTNYGTDTGDNVLVGFYGSTTDSVQQIFKNGEVLVGDASGHTVSTVGNIFIGSDGGSTYQDTTIGEVIIVNGTVSQADRQKLEGYLAHKWGLAGSLPGDHPYKAAPPGGAGASADMAADTSDADGNPLTLTWTKVSGTGTVSFSDASAEDPTAYFSEADTYVLQLEADDGVFQTTDTVTITVTTSSDSDGDGMDDSWETDNFGDLTRDGTGDYDSDGVDDLTEFTNGTDPTTDDIAPPAPTNLLATSGNGSVSLNWDDSIAGDFLGFTLYRSTTEGSGYSLVESGLTASEFTDTSVNNDTTYYYVVRAGDTSGNASTDSTEVSATPTGDLLVSVGPDGDLVYETYANQGQLNKVHTVPDFSRAGYGGGGVEIPFVPAEVTLSPSGGDDTLAIQNAIDTVSALPLVNGFRGAVVLQAGEYTVSDTLLSGNGGALTISASGVVIRGEGQQETGGTTITYTATTQSDLFHVHGSSNPSYVGSSARDISDSYVPVGSFTVTVTDASPFAPGDFVRIRNIMNQQWVEDIGMTVAGGLGGEPDDPAWNPADFQVSHYRYIESINGNELTLDAPITQTIEDQYGGGEVLKYTYTGAIENVGIENIRLESTYTAEDDEDHGWQAIEMRRVKNGWVRQVTAQYFGMGLILVDDVGQFITVEDSAMLDPKSITTGGRKYSFNVDDSTYNLVQRTLSRGARHDYASGSLTPGPNVFVDGLAIQSNSDIGPHFRWATGELYDNIRTDNDINVQNRLNAGTSHGWAGAQIMFWNVEAQEIRSDAPTGAMNWSIGTVGIKAESPSFMSPWEPFGIWQSEQSPVAPRSLYYAQLKDRLGTDAMRKVILPEQESGRIWTALQSWDGDGLLLDGVVAWYDDSASPEVLTDITVNARIRDLNIQENLTSTTWSKVTGPGGVTFGDDSLLETTVNFDTLGTYEIQLTADDGSRQVSGSFTIVVTDPNGLGTPAAPTGLVATAGEGQVSLDWNDNGEADLASYKVYRSTTSGSYGAAIANVSSPTSTYVDSSAVPGTTYFYVVTAVDDDLNESIVSNEDLATPTEPNQIPVFDSDPLVKAAAEVNALYSGSLADDAGDGNDDPITFSLISGPEWLSVSTNGGLSGTPLSVGSVPNTWTIQVEDDRGGSSQTELRITVNADATAPAAPAGLAATPGNNQVTLDWNENGETDFDSYMVYRSVTTGSPYTQLQSGLTENSYTDETAENGTEYFYVVRAVDNAGNISSDSNEAPATPTAPTEVQVLATDNAYIRWSSPDTVFDVSEFFMADRNQFIYGAREAYIRFPLTGEDEMGGVSIENIESVTLELYSTNTSSHIIYVYAMLDGVQSEVSDQSESSWTGGTGGTGGNLTPNTRPFGKDAHLPVTNLSTVKLGEAQNVASGEVLQITITEMEVFRELIRNDTNGEITLVMNSSESGGDNFFASVYNSGGNPVPALRAGVTPPDVTPPAAPTGLAATPLDASVMLDWNDSLEEDFANYTVYRSTTEGTGHTELQAGLTGSEYLDDTAINGTEYFYVVRALDLTGNLSAASVEASAIPLPDPPAAPTNPDATGGRKSVSLSWTDASTTETGFIVQRSITSGSGFTTVTTTAADATSFIDTGLQAGTPYFYQVLATNTGGNSSPTQQVSATTWTEQEEYFDDSGISHDADPADDSDGDGISNEDEFIVQTDPDDPASTFTATVEAPAAGEDVAFTVPTASGRYYRVLYRNSLESGDWMVLEGYENIDSNVTNPVRVEDSLSDSSNRFYRVEVQMTPFSTP